MNVSEIFVDVFYLLLILVILGTLGFKYFADLDWIHSFQTAIFFVTGLGTTTEMPTGYAKIWSAIFALIATTIFIGIAANVVAYVIQKKYIRLDKQKI